MRSIVPIIIITNIKTEEIIIFKDKMIRLEEIKYYDLKGYYSYHQIYYYQTSQNDGFQIYFSNVKDEKILLAK